jgi:predicted outer membrane protein
MKMNDKSLRDLIRNKKASPESLTPEQKQQFETLKRKVDQFQGKDANDVMKEIDRLKQNREVMAKLKGKELDTFASTLKPVLNSQQKQKLDEIVKYLRQG